MKGWLKEIATTGLGSRGFAVDRFQTLRGVGSLADVKRFNKALQDAKLWPFESNLSYAAHEVMYYNYEAKRQARLNKEKVVEVRFWSGQVLSQFADKEVELPSVEKMAQFDTLELDVIQRCPRTNVPEIGNCGAWDYLAHLRIYAGKNKEGKDIRLEVARLITTYHREGR